MKINQTPYGTYYAGSKEELFKKQVELIIQTTKLPKPTVALSGGSTPKEFYKWCINTQALAAIYKPVHWFTSDERMVSIEHEESNFGTADTHLLKPLNVNATHKHPWSTELPAAEAASTLNNYWKDQFMAKTCFDLCLLGLGEDCHIASIFPNSPLLENNAQSHIFFAAVTVPQKGHRLTITPAGLAACKHISVLVVGKNKAAAIKNIFEQPYNPQAFPAHVLKANATKVSWLVNTEA
jgi:6-phosphogluconolactonase